MESDWLLKHYVHMALTTGPEDASGLYKRWAACRLVRDCKLKRSCSITAPFRCRWLGELSQMRNALLRPGSAANGKDAEHLAKVLSACVAHVSLLHEQQHKALVSLLLSMPIWESTQVILPCQHCLGMLPDRACSAACFTSCPVSAQQRYALATRFMSQVPA